MIARRLLLLVLVTGLVIGAMAYLPAESHAAKVCDYQYFYDAAHTQYAGLCIAACFPGENYCIGDITGYFALVDCRPECNS